MRLKDKIVLVTASTRGIGLACVKACAKEGAAVCMAARNLERAQEIADELNAEGGNVKCVFNDATKPETFTSMVNDVVKDAGRVDVLVNNFGTSNPGKDLDFANTDPSIFFGYRQSESAKCLYSKSSSGEVYGGTTRRQYYKYFIRRQYCA